MGPPGDDPSFIDHHDTVGALGASQPVRDDDRRPTLQEHRQRTLHVHLGLRVEVRRRLVEHDHGGIGEERPGEGHELTFTRGESATALARLGVEAVGQRSDPFVDAHRP